MSKKGMKYDYKKAYDKNLKPSARLHYLENARHDQDNGSPNHLSGLGTMTGLAIGRAAAARGNFDRAKYENLAQKGGVFGRIAQQVLAQNPAADPTQAVGAAPAAPVAPVAPVAPTADMSIGAAMGGGGMDPTNPFEGKTFQITPANMMGNAKPTFSEQTQGMAQTAFGSGLERQMSMPNSGSVTQMTAKQEKAFGPGSEVYESGNTAIYKGLKEKE